MFRFNNTLILKITKDCNLRCSYCYVHNKDDFRGQMIDFELYKKLIQRVISDRKKQLNTQEKLHLVFHGGEPLMAKIDYLAKLLEYAKINFDQNDIRHSFGMQSNLTLMTEDYVMLLKKYNVALGVSFDGIKDNNSSRTSLNQEYYENKFKLMDKYNLDYGFLIVAGEKNIKNVWKTAKYLRKKYGKNVVKVNYVEDVNNVGGETDGKTFFEYGWKPFYEEYFKTGLMREANSDQIIDKYLHYLFNGRRLENMVNCGDTICGAGINIVEVEPNGNISLCGRYSEDYQISHIQNVVDRDFLALHQIKRYLDFATNKQKVLINVGCDNCYAKNICDHGCMAFHYSKFGEYGIRTDLICDIYKETHKYITQHIVDILHAKFIAYTKNHNIFEVSLTNITAKRCIIINDTIFNLLRKKYNIVVQEKPDDEKKLVFTRIE